MYPSLPSAIESKAFDPANHGQSRDPASQISLWPPAWPVSTSPARCGEKRRLAFLFKNAVFPPAYLLGRLLFPRVVADAATAESVIQASGLDCTIVRPPELTDRPRPGKYRVRTGHLPVFGFSISRADVGDFMLKAAGKLSTIKNIYGISN